MATLFPPVKVTPVEGVVVEVALYFTIQSVPAVAAGSVSSPSEQKRFTPAVFGSKVCADTVKKLPNNTIVAIIKTVLVKKLFMGIFF
ncbi:hypothetical protein D3C85_1239170 [compost metagenome]